MQKPLNDNTQHSKETDIHARRNSNPQYQHQAVAGPRLRSSGQWDRQLQATSWIIQKREFWGGDVAEKYTVMIVGCAHGVISFICGYVDIYHSLH
jgi:hypothetical protein